MKANDVIQKYNTTNPYEIAKINRIVVILEPLGKIHGYYNKASDQTFIHLNDEVPEYFREYMLSHLLYPALRGENEMMFLTEKHSASLTESEKRAHRFALELLAQSCTEKV